MNFHVNSGLEHNLPKTEWADCKVLKLIKLRICFSLENASTGSIGPMDKVVAVVHQSNMDRAAARQPSSSELAHARVTGCSSSRRGFLERERR
jgi:hypothetical protein